MSSEQNNASSPSPTPSPTPQPHYRTLEELKRNSSPTPTPTPSPPTLDVKAIAKSLGASAFDWNELNRANEILKFFDTAITVFVRKADVAPEIIAMLRIALATRLSEIVLRKYQMTLTSFNIETAINIIDEQLPKLLKSGNILNVDDALKMWGTLRDIIVHVLTLMRGGASGQA